MIEDIFGSIFDDAFRERTRKDSFSKVWRSNNNPVNRVGKASRRSMDVLATKFQEERDSFDGGALDLENYLGDLDALQAGLFDVASTITDFTGDPIKDRSTLRATRQKAIAERQRAKSILEGQQGVRRLEEKAEYIDPMTGEVTELRDVPAPAVAPAMGNLFNRAEAYFDSRMQQAMVETGETSHQAMLRMAGAEDDHLSSGNTDFIISQMRAGFGELAGNAVAGQLEAYQAELSTRQQSAMAELEQRKKANKTATATEKKRIKQVADINKSISDINSMFVQTDAKFAQALKGQGNTGIDFRADRPS